MQNTVGEYTIPAISEFTIVDVFPYFDGGEDKEADTNEELTERVIPVTG